MTVIYATKKFLENKSKHLSRDVSPLWVIKMSVKWYFYFKFCWSSRKSVILHRQFNKNIKFTMLQRRMNNWNTVSYRGIKCLERLSCVHTSGIGAFYTFGDIFRRTFDRTSGIRWCWYPAETINENRRRVLTKLFDGFCLMPVGDVRTMCSSPSIPSTGWIVTYY